MYQEISTTDKNLLLSIARKGFVRAGLPSAEWAIWYDDATQVAAMSLVETAGDVPGKRITRAKWAVFDFVVCHVYGQMTDWGELPDRNLFDETEDDVEWELVARSFHAALSPPQAAIATMLVAGKSNWEIADLLGYKNEDSARAMVSRTRRKIKEVLNQGEYHES